MRRALAAVAVGLGALPLIVAQPVPLVDWPNHLARVFIGTRLLAGDAHWARFYTLNTSPVPNAALDLGIGGLVLLGLPLDFAASAFLVIAYGVFIAGVCRLARAYGALDASKPVLAAALFFTGPLMFGLVNYVLGLGLAFGLAGIALDGRLRRRWAVAVLGTVALFYVHLIAAPVFLLILGCADVSALVARRGSMRRVGASLAGGAVFAALLLASSAGADSLPRADASNIFYPGHGSTGATLLWKGGIVLRMATDHATPLCAAASVAGALIWLVLARPSRLGRAALLAAGAAFALVLALPESAGTGSLLDYRLVLVALAVAAAGLRWRGGRMAQAGFATLLALMLGRTADFTLAFARQSEVVRGFDRAAAALAPDTMLLIARGRSDDEIGHFAWWSPPMEHVGTRAALHGVFVPTVFAVASQQPVVLRPAFAQWRHEWRVATGPELAALMHDIAPLCAAVAEDAGPGGIRHVALLEVYAGAVMRDGLDPAAILAEQPAFRLIDPCMAAIRPS